MKKMTLALDKLNLKYQAETDGQYLGTGPVSERGNHLLRDKIIKLRSAGEWGYKKEKEEGVSQERKIVRHSCLCQMLQKSQARWRMRPLTIFQRKLPVEQWGPELDYKGLGTEQAVRRQKR